MQYFGGNHPLYIVAIIWLASKIPPRGTPEKRDRERRASTENGDSSHYTLIKMIYSKEATKLNAFGGSPKRNSRETSNGNNST